ncbi:MAG: adenylate/guanylate cyclase domain-containing protein [Verrucomicrobiaceae bacterium]|nr:adenylate/guanylate cyclase domain-containing protein [Verrucomicrobiaceae bacterium]
MNKIKASVLLIGVVVCVPLLALYRFGLFNELNDVVLRFHRDHFVLPVPELQRATALSYASYTLAAFLAAWVCVELSSMLQRLAFLFGLVFLSLTASCVGAWQGVLFEPFSTIAATLAAGILGLAFSGSERERRVHLFRQFFVGRISTDLFAKLTEGNEPVALTGRREVTSLTCRIINTSQLATDMEPQDVEQLTSAFLKAVSEYLVERGAYLDVSNSQGITAQFGFPAAAEDHAHVACKLALQLREFLNELSAELEKRWQRKPVLGIALASGPVVGGLIGYGEFQRYSVLGEPPELSRRLCNMNGVYGSQLLIAASTWTAAKEHIEVRPMEMIAAPGQTGAREVYELLGEKETLTKGALAARDSFWQGVVALRQGDAKAALEKLRQAIVVGQDDPPLRYFKERAEALLKEPKDKPHVRKSEQSS